MHPDNRYYTGVGSRSTPPDIQIVMRDAAGFWPEKAIFCVPAALMGPTLPLKPVRAGGLSYSCPGQVLMAADLSISGFPKRRSIWRGNFIHFPARFLRPP